MKNAAQFWADRVTKQFKETYVSSVTLGNELTSSNPAAIAWAKSFSELLDALQKYIKQYHTTGVTWNPKVSFQFHVIWGNKLIRRATQLHLPFPPLPLPLPHLHLHLPIHRPLLKQPELPPVVPQVQEPSSPLSIKVAPSLPVSRRWIHPR
jgi:hypothetical protein